MGVAVVMLKVLNYLKYGDVDKIQAVIPYN